MLRDRAGIDEQIVDGPVLDIFLVADPQEPDRRVGVAERFEVGLVDFRPGLLLQPAGHRVANGGVERYGIVRELPDTLVLHQVGPPPLQFLVVLQLIMVGRPRALAVLQEGEHVDPALDRSCPRTRRLAESGKKGRSQES